jgi:glycosyltransferase involved in cell wall biosynthesis
MAYKVSVIIPSMNRPDRLKRCVESLKASVSNPEEVECITVIDCDMESQQSMIGMLWPVVMFSPERLGAITSWNIGLMVSRSNRVVFAGDDLEWTPGWLDMAIKAHQEKLGGYGMLGFNDGYQNGNTLAVHYLIDKQFVKDIFGGRIAFPMFEFYCNDTVANRLAKKVNRFWWDKSVLVAHHHYTQTGVKDDLDRENESKLNRDIQKLEEWIQRGELVEWTSVI